MRLGVLDIGSNSAQLQIVDALPGAPPLPMHALKVGVLLGEDLGPEGEVSPEGIERVSRAVQSVLESARRYHVDQLYPFVTAVIRDAPNREQVLDDIEREAGIRPEYLSGQDEARLTYLAVHRWYGWSAGQRLLLDIGGGSMEIVLGRDAEPNLVVSLPLGAGRMTRMFIRDDPPRKQELRRMRRHVRDMLRETADRLHWECRAQVAVGSSKTFKQLARLCGAAPQNRGPFVRRTLSRKTLAKQIPRLAELTTARRADLPGVSAGRARQIVAGAVIAHTAMRTLGVHELEISPWALREGVMLEHLGTLTPRPHDLPLTPLTPALPTPVPAALTDGNGAHGYLPAGSASVGIRTWR